AFSALAAGRRHGRRLDEDPRQATAAETGPVTRPTQGEGTFDMKARALAATALLSFAGCACAAQTIYRCGTEGNVIYAQTPCPEGRVVEATDPRSAAQRADAR